MDDNIFKKDLSKVVVRPETMQVNIVEDGALRIKFDLFVQSEDHIWFHLRQELGKDLFKNMQYFGGSKDGDSTRGKVDRKKDSGSSRQGRSK